MSAGASASIPVSSELASLFSHANTVNTVRAIIVQIEKESFVSRGDTRSSVSAKRDFESAASLAKPPCYILFHTSGKNQWVLISYVPDSSSVHDRMLYASAKGNLLKSLGNHFFAAEMHASSSSDLTYASYEALVLPSSSPKPYSAHELAHQEILQEEEAERKFRAQLRSSPSSSSSGSGVGSPGAQLKKGSGIGGYHTVTIPLTPSAKSAATSSSFVEFAINDDQTAVNALSQASISDLSAVKSRLCASEPRFYLLKSVGRNTLIYCCPDASPSKLRMVYSTAKPSIKSQLESALGITLKTLEIRGADDLSSDSFSSSSSYSSSSPSYGAYRASPKPASPSSSSSTVQTPHPVYNMISVAQGTGSPRPTSKKIVIPPPGAY